MFDAKGILTPLAQSNYYQVSFSSLKPSVTNHLTFMGIGNVRDFISRKSGILCSEASLPASAFTTGEVKGDFMGVPQEFAHTRIYTDIDFTFYIAITSWRAATHEFLYLWLRKKQLLAIEISCSAAINFLLPRQSQG